MKKILFAAIALFIGSGAIAQDVRLGIKAGTNFSTLTGLSDEISDMFGGLNKMGFGVHVGGFLEYAFNERFSLHPEILYSRQGTDLDGHLLKVSISGYYSLNYINIPILLKVNIAEGLSVEIGPQVGFLISSYRTITLKNTETNAELEIATGSITSKSNTVDFTAAIGLSYTFAENFVVSARYGLGLTKVSKTSGNNWKNSVIQLSVGYKF